MMTQRRGGVQRKSSDDDGGMFPIADTITTTTTTAIHHKNRTPSQILPLNNHRRRKRRTKNSSSSCDDVAVLMYQLQLQLTKGRHNWQTIRIVSVALGCFVFGGWIIAQRSVLDWLDTPTQHRLDQPSMHILSTSQRIRRQTESIFTSPTNHNNVSIVLSRIHAQQPLSLSRHVVMPSGQYYISYGHDFGGLDLRIAESAALRLDPRKIYHDFHDEKGYDELLDEADDDGDMEYYYAFDDDQKRNPLTAWDDPDVHLRKQCRRTSWHRNLPINCNNVHEFDFQGRVRDGNTRYLDGGSYREVYLSTLPNNESIVFKSFFWGSEFQYDDFEFMRMDAIVNEKLNGNPRIVKSYGFCGTGIMGESMINGDLEKLAVPNEVGRFEKPLDDKGQLVVRNNLSGTKKLELSLEMAEAVLLLHSFSGGVIVHDDIQLSQFLISSTGELKLNDFNRAEIMLWNEKDQEYCKYRNNPGAGDWRAPEEYHDKPLDEKIDIWSLGNNMYALLTGLYPFYDVKEEEVPNKVKKGMQAFIDPRYKERSYAEAKLTEIIPLCWTYDPTNRIDVFQLVELLRVAIRDDKRAAKKLNE